MILINQEKKDFFIGIESNSIINSKSISIFIAEMGNKIHVRFNLNKRQHIKSRNKIKSTYVNTFTVVLVREYIKVNKIVNLVKTLYYQET